MLSNSERRERDAEIIRLAESKMEPAAIVKALGVGRNVVAGVIRRWRESVAWAQGDIYQSMSRQEAARVAREAQGPMAAERIARNREIVKKRQGGRYPHEIAKEVGKPRHAVSQVLLRDRIKRGLPPMSREESGVLGGEARSLAFIPRRAKQHRPSAPKSHPPCPKNAAPAVRVKVDEVRRSLNARVDALLADADRLISDQ